MTKHTPGPWKIQESYISEPIGSEPTYVEPGVWAESPDDGMDKHIATIRCGLAGTDANARLISVAPNLLDDGKKLCNELAGIMGAYELRQLLGNTNFTVLFERWEAMRATIAKAEGAR